MKLYLYDEKTHVECWAHHDNFWEDREDYLLQKNPAEIHTDRELLFECTVHSTGSSVFVLFLHTWINVSNSRAREKSIWAYWTIEKSSSF